MTVKPGVSTPSCTVVVSVSVPDVPATVSVYCPGTAELAAVSVNVLYVVVGVRDHAAVTPLGRPETARFTLPLNPYCGLTAMLVLARGSLANIDTRRGEG